MGMNAGGDIALDDITVSHEGCYNEPVYPPGNNNGNLKLYSAVYQALNAIHGISTLFYFPFFGFAINSGWAMWLKYYIPIQIISFPFIDI